MSSPTVHLASERVDPEGGRERNEAPAVHSRLRSSACLTKNTAHQAGHGNALLLLLGQQDAPRKPHQQRQKENCYERRIGCQPGD